MADEHLFTAEMPQATPVGRSGWRTCLTGCAIAAVILLVIAILLGVWVARNARTWASDFSVEVTRQVVNSSQLPVEEKQQIMVEVERVGTAFREKKISMEKLGALMEKLAKSPLMPMIVTSTIGQHYLAASGLSAEEKEAGKQTLQRFFRGALDQKINEAGIDAAMAKVADRDANGQWQVRQTLTDAELKAFLAEAKKQADEAGVPEQTAEVDPSDEIKKIVDEALGPAES